MVEKVNIYFVMQIGVFKVIYLPNECIKSKNCERTYQFVCLLLKKLKTTEGLNAIQEIPNALFLLDTVIQTCRMWQHLRKVSRCSQLVPYPGKNNLQRNTNLKTKRKLLHLIRGEEKSRVQFSKKEILPNLFREKE